LGIPSMIHYPTPLYKQPAVICDLNFQNSDAAALEVLSLPIYGTLKSSIQERIIECLLDGEN